MLRGHLGTDAVGLSRRLFGQVKGTFLIIACWETTMLLCRSCRALELLMKPCVDPRGWWAASSSVSAVAYSDCSLLFPSLVFNCITPIRKDPQHTQGTHHESQPAFSLIRHLVILLRRAYDSLLSTNTAASRHELENSTPETTPCTPWAKR